MNRKYLPLLLLLATALAVEVVLSVCAPVSVFGFELRNGGFAEVFAPRAEAQLCEQSATALPSDSAAGNAIEAPADTVRVDTTIHTVLIVGDSMLEGLGPRLAAYAAANDFTLYSVIWYSSTSEYWGRSTKLSDYMRRLKPDFVFICLGANELFVRNIEQSRSKYVAKIIADLGDTPYLWIGPPNWKPDTGINLLIEQHAAPGCYYRSAELVLERAADGAHPTHDAANRWTDSVVDWMSSHAPVMPPMERPTVATARPKRVFVHSPQEK